MAPHQAQRTLVKSKPELWAEVSDVASLCKHLGEFGEITITRLEPETTVAWEGTAARGTVELEASGWGTKVTLTAELVDGAEAPAPVEASAEADTTPDAAVAEPAAEAAVEDATPDAEEAEEEIVATVDQTADAEAPEAPVAEPIADPLDRMPAVEEGAPPPSAAAQRAAARMVERDAKPAKVGFFGRLFGRKAGDAEAVAAASEPEPVAAEPVLETQADAVTEPVAAETPADPVALETPPTEPTPLHLVPDTDDDRVVPLRPEVDPAEADEDPNPPLVAEAEAVVAPEVAPTPVRVIDGERAVAVLTNALDDLGAAHRRPFSRS